MVLRLGKGLGYVFYRLGFALRETGQALDRVGSRMEGSWAFREERALWEMACLCMSGLLKHVSISYCLRND